MATELGELNAAKRNSAAAQEMIDAGGADASTYGARLGTLVGLSGATGTVATAANLRAFDTGFKIVTPEGLELAAATVAVPITSSEVAIDGDDFWWGIVTAAEATVDLASAANLNGWWRLLELFANGQETTFTDTGGTFDLAINFTFPLVVPSGERRVLVVNQDASANVRAMLIGGGSDPASASDTVAGIVELAIASEVNTGSDATRAVTPDALAGSNLGTAVIEVEVFGPAADVLTGDGKAYATIPACVDGMNLVRAQATVVTAGTTNATTVMVHNLTQAADMLSGAISIASAGVAGTVGTIDTNNDDVATNDRIRIDVDSVSTTAPKGLTVILEFRLP